MICIESSPLVIGDAAVDSLKISWSRGINRVQCSGVRPRATDLYRQIPVGHRAKPTYQQLHGIITLIKENVWETSLSVPE